MNKPKKILKKPVWLKYDEEEVVSIISKIIEKEPELTTEKIGMILRDNYGIPTTRIYGKKLNSFIEKIKGKEVNADLTNMQKKVEKIKKHLEKNKTDMVCKRALIKNNSRLKKIESLA